MDWKSLLIKAAWAGAYGMLAELVATQSFTKETVVVTLVVALARGTIIFVTTIKDEVTKPTTTRGFIKQSWKDNL